MLALAASIALAPSLSVFVAPTGSDTAAGTRTRPLATLDGAIRAIRKQVHAKATITLLPGTYHQWTTVDFGPQDANLTIRGEGKVLPTVTGGRELRVWRSLGSDPSQERFTPEARRHILICDLARDEPIPDLGSLQQRGFGLQRRAAGLELFFNGKPMPLAQWPNGNEWLRIKGVSPNRTIAFAEDRPVTWKPSKDWWVLGYWQYDWAESYERLSSLDPTTRQFTLATNPPIPPFAGRRFRFLNVMEELDSPGEWYLDREARRLYFWPPASLGGAQVVASVLPAPMIRAKGVHNLTIENLCLEAGRDGAIQVDGGANVSVEDCFIRNFGTYGVALRNSTDSRVAHCDLTGLGELGIELSGGDRKTLTPAHLVAEDNHIWSYSRWCRTYQPAVLVNGVGNRVSHNLITDAPHNAILLDGNDHLLEYNDVARVCTETGDAGAFYMGRDTTMRGTVIRFNRFRATAPTVNTQGNFTEVMSVYLDDCWAGTTVFGNVFEGPGIGVMIGGGRDNTVQNNVFLDKKPGIVVDARGKGWAAKYFVPNGEWRFFEKIADVNATKPPYSTRYPPLANILADDIAFPKGNRILSNLAIGGRFLLLDGVTEQQAGVVGNVVEPGPTTVEQALRKTPKGFTPIPLRAIGLTTKRRPAERLPG